MRRRIPPSSRSLSSCKTFASSSSTASPLPPASHRRRGCPRRPSPPPPSFASSSSSSSSSSSYSSSIPSYGFSGAGFLGCYHVGVASCLRRHGHLPHPSSDATHGGGGSSPPPRLTGVSAGSMIAASIALGVDPDPDGMEVVLEASRRTREMSTLYLDALTPGLSLVDNVEGPLRRAMARALGGYCDIDGTIRDVDPILFRRRVPDGSLRIGLTHRDGLLSMSDRDRYLDSYRYVESYRDVEDVVSCCMLSSYIPGLTGPLHAMDNVLPAFLRGLMGGRNDVRDVTTVGERAGVGYGGADGTSTRNDACIRAGARLNEMTNVGLVRHGTTGRPVGGMMGHPRGGGGGGGQRRRVGVRNDERTNAHGRDTIDNLLGRGHRGRISHHRREYRHRRAVERAVRSQSVDMSPDARGGGRWIRDER